MRAKKTVISKRECVKFYNVYPSHNLILSLAVLDGLHCHHECLVRRNTVVVPTLRHPGGFVFDICLGLCDGSTAPRVDASHFLGRLVKIDKRRVKKIFRGCGCRSSDWIAWFWILKPKPIAPASTTRRKEIFRATVNKLLAISTAVPLLEFELFRAAVIIWNHGWVLVGLRVLDYFVDDKDANNPCAPTKSSWGPRIGRP